MSSKIAPKVLPEEKASTVERAREQCRVGSRKNCHFRIECANKCPGYLNGERTPEQYGFGYCN